MELSVRGMSLETSLTHLWDAHLSSLHEGLPLAAPLLPGLASAKEAQFGVSWANLVDFVAALKFNVNYNNTNFLQGMVVPPRMLKDRDHAPFISDFTGAQNRALLASALLFKANSDGSVLRIFRTLCCTAAGRAAAYDALVGFLQKPIADVWNFFRLLWELS